MSIYLAKLLKKKKPQAWMDSLKDIVKIEKRRSLRDEPGGLQYRKMQRGGGTSKGDEEEIANDAGGCTQMSNENCIFKRRGWPSLLNAVGCLH